MDKKMMVGVAFAVVLGFFALGGGVWVKGLWSRKDGTDSTVEDDWLARADAALDERSIARLSRSGVHK
jgi:hypothetical protein